MNRQPFAVVVSGPSRLAFAGSPETVAKLVPVHDLRDPKRTILPGDWERPDYKRDRTYLFIYGGPDLIALS